MADDTEGDGAVSTTYTVKVQRSMQDLEIDDYDLGEGFKPVVESSPDRELWIYKTANNQTQTLVTLYAQGTWLRAWIEETS